MRTTDSQVRKLMEEMRRHGKVGLAAAKAGMDRKTARKYLREAKLPSQLVGPRDWRTRADPFGEDWAAIASRLSDAPELEAKTLFEDLLVRRPGRYHEGQLRTLQRRVKQWRAQHGPAKEVYFAQEHRPGEAAQTDFTDCNCLKVTICGEPFEHMLCHLTLPYSNWQWASVCSSESLLALRHGVQEALFRLGRRPEWHQTDNSTAATHNLPTGKREFNEEYLRFMEHLGMKPRTIAVGKKHQNGDIESQNGALKRRLEQHLLLRGSRDFESVQSYQSWVWSVLDAANKPREEKVKEELAAMRPLCVDRLPEYREIEVRVSSWSTISVKRNTYSIPSRLIREKVRVRIFDDRLEVFYGGTLQLTMERLHGEGRHRINYRHIIFSLVQKPGAFARYRYREDLFPTMAFRRAYDALCERLSSWKADMEYLRILQVAAQNMESTVEQALEELLEGQELPTSERVKSLVAPDRPKVPEMAEPEVDLGEYDDHLEELMEVPA